MSGPGTFHSRAAWHARAPRSRTALRPTFGVTVHYEGVDLGAYSHDRCAGLVRGIQAFHMDQRGWVDIAYSCLVCRHGETWEGRWAGVRTAANGTNAGNDAALAVCALLGPNDQVSDELVEGIAHAAVMLRRAGTPSGVNGHRDWKPTACPDSDLYARIPAIRLRAAQLAAAAPGSSTKVPPMLPNIANVVDAMAVPQQYGGAGCWVLAADGAVYTTGGAPYKGGMNPGTPNAHHFAGRTAARLEPYQGRYLVVATSGEKYDPLAT